MAQIPADPPAGAPPGALRTPVAERVVVHGSDVHVERAHFEVPLAEARSRYGGTSVPAVLAGALAGLGTASLLAGLASAVGLQVGQELEPVEQGVVTEFAVGGAVAAVVVLALSALVAGWVAGRVARFDGGRNGVLSGLVLALLVAVLGAVVTAAHASGLSPVSAEQELTVAAVVAGLVGLAVALLGGLVGGRRGTRWHRDVDDVMVGTRPGAMAVPSRTEVVR